MFINGVKITLIMCLTILVSVVLFISYNEYISRYSVIAAQDSSVYIFDKKSTVLNRCDEKGCELLDTKLPNRSSFGLQGMGFEESRMPFGQEKNMARAVAQKDDIRKDEPADEKNKEKETASASQKEKEDKNEKISKDEPVKEKEQKETEEKKDTEKKKKSDTDDEFIE